MTRKLKNQDVIVNRILADIQHGAKESVLIVHFLKHDLFGKGKYILFLFEKGNFYACQKLFHIAKTSFINKTGINWSITPTTGRVLTDMKF